MKKIIAVLLLVIMITQLTSCMESKSGGRSSNLLTVYFGANSSEFFIKDIPSQFNSMNKDVKIKVKSIPNYELSDYNEKLTAELLDGQGPDIVIVPNNIRKLYLNELVQKDVFADLNELIKADENFKLSDYYEKVLDAGVFDGKRYLIPTTFSIPALYTTREILTENGIRLTSEALDWNSVRQAALEQQPKVQGKYLLSKLEPIDIIKNSNVGFIDYKNKKAAFDSNEFRDVLKLYKELSSTTCPVEKSVEIGMTNPLKNDSIVLANGTMGTMGQIYNSYNGLEGEYTPEIYPLPAYKAGEGVLAEPLGFMAINGKCKNKEAAWSFIKMVLSNQINTSESASGLPVNKKAYATYERKMQIKAETTEEQETLKSFTNIVGRISMCKLNDSYIYNRIGPYFMDYINNKKTVEETVKAIQERVNSYLNEPMPRLENFIDLNEKDENNTGTLKLYVPQHDLSMQNAVVMYKEKYKNVKLDIVNFSDILEYRNKVSVELMAGEGPDIIDLHGTFRSIRKVLQNGLLCDLNEFISKDNEFKLSDYNQKAIQCGVIDGKRYFIPGGYMSRAFLTTDKAIEQYKVNPDTTNWTWESFAKAGAEFISRNKGDERYLYPWIGLSQMVRDYGMGFIDYSNRKSHFNSAEFEKLLKTWIQIAKASSPEGFSSSTVPVKDTFKNEQMMPFLLSPMLLNIFDSRHVKVMKTKTHIYPFPTYDNSKTTACVPVNIIGINARSKSKKAAFDFIKLYISKELYLSRYNNSDTYKSGDSIPTNTEVFKELMKSYSSSEYLRDEWYPYSNNSLGQSLCKAVPLSNELVQQLNSINENIRSGEIMDTEISKMIDEYQYDLLDGKKTVEKFANELHEKVSIYINE